MSLVVECSSFSNGYFSNIFVVLLAFNRKNSEKESLGVVSKMESVLLYRLPFFLNGGGYIIYFTTKQNSVLFRLGEGKETESISLLDKR